MESRYQDRKRYFDELAETSGSFYLDYVRKFISIGPGTRVLEIGCGEGGNLLPFAQAGCEVTGVDLAEGKIENARRWSDHSPVPIYSISQLRRGCSTWSLSMMSSNTSRRKTRLDS